MRTRRQGDGTRFRRLRRGGRPAPVAEHDTGSARLPYLPALDGLRAVALVAVLCFHAGFSWIHGGYLPLTAFFVLSGFLITSLLLLEQQRSGYIRLRAFWGRRARRLVPAALLALVLIAVYTAAVHRPAPGLRGDVFAALGWATNWRFIFAKRSYTDLFGDPSPLQHFWSLSVEEQFYLVLPLLAVGSLVLSKGRRWVFAAVTAVLVAASTLTMRMLYQPGKAPLRAYFGTDTRAAELLVGVLLALVLIGPHGLRRLTGPTRWAVNLAGTAALAVSVALWFVTHEYDSRLYQGGLLGIALLAALVVAAGTQEGTIVSRLLSLWPLAALGRISYGVYLFHWPLFLWLNENRTGLSGGPLFALRMAVTMALAIASYQLLELPIRGNRRLPRLQLVGWANASVGIAAVLVVVSAVTSPALTTVQSADGPAPKVIRATAPTTTSSSTPTTVAAASGAITAATAAPAGTATTVARRRTDPTTTPTVAPTTVPPTTVAPPPPPLRVMVVGDSVAVNLATGLTQHLKKFGDMELLSYAFNGCPGLVDGVMRWPDGTEHTVPSNCAPRRSEWASQVASFHPDIVLVHSSIYDIYDRKVPGWSDFLTIGDPTFNSWLQTGEQQIINTLAAGGAKVVWATVPCANWQPNQYPNHFAPNEGNRRIEVLDSLIRQNGAAIADLDGQLCPGGSFSSTVAGVPNARPDGVHLTDAAAGALADRWLAPLLLGLR